MKKLSLLLLGLALGSAGVYGQMAIGTNFSLTGEATTTAGYDIDDEQFGFKNEVDSSIKIELVAEQSVKKPDEVMSGWYGSIELNDFQIIIDSAEEDSPEFVTDATATPVAKARTGLYVVAPDIVATLKNGPLWLKIYSDPDNKADLVSHIEEDEDNDKTAESHDKDKDVGSTELFAGSGIALGYTTPDLSIGIGVSSEETYDADVTATNADAETGSFAISSTMKVNVGPATLDLAFVQGLENGDEAEDMDKDDDTGISAMLSTDFGEISLSAGADVLMTGDEDNPDTTQRDESIDWEGGGNATVTLTPNSSLKADVIFSSLGNVATDVKVGLTDKAGLVENLDLALTWGLFDVTGGTEDMPGAADDQINDKSDLTLEGSLDYHLMDTLGGTLTPGTTVKVNQVDGGDASVDLEVRAVLKEAVPATEFGLKWQSAQLVASGDTPSQSGTVSIWTKIKY
ncbi:MAG: hypothetical protein OXC31_17360 [Spirochaetaceae bacterium]|nr:hypothetical protein [Spirochaetaceae bacterium]